MRRLSPFSLVVLIVACASPAPPAPVTGPAPATVVDDGSYDVYIGPKKPDGKVNWIQTDPSKGWNMLWRIYGPLQAWYDKKWRPSEIEIVK